MKKLVATLSLALCTIIAAHAQESTVGIGQKAPELVLATPAGPDMKLSEVNKGRVVLLDFWASWCGPCRRSSPGLVSIYNKFKDQKFKGAKKGFTVVSVSLDRDKAAWMKAIQDDNYTWPYHMSDLGYWQSKACTIYGINSIPQCLLIGPDGKVIGKYQLAEQADADIAKLVKKG